jgi:hypothetical protein
MKSGWKFEEFQETLSWTGLHLLGMMAIQPVTNDHGLCLGCYVQPVLCIVLALSGTLFMQLSGHWHQLRWQQCIVMSAPAHSVGSRREMCSYTIICICYGTAEDLRSRSRDRIIYICTVKGSAWYRCSH